MRLGSKWSGIKQGNASAALAIGLGTGGVSPFAFTFKGLPFTFGGQSFTYGAP